MIKCNIKRGKRISVNASGKLKDISEEVLVLIQQVHSGLQKESPEAAARFKLNIFEGIIDPDGPAWKEIPIDTIDEPKKEEP